MPISTGSMITYNGSHIAHIHNYLTSQELTDILSYWLDLTVQHYLIYKEL